MTSTRTTVRASSFSARRCAAVAPTLPAPTTVILFITVVRSPSAGVHLAVRIGAQRIDPVERPSVPHAEPLLCTAIGAPLPPASNEVRELRVRDTTPQRLAEVDAPRGVEAEEPGPVGGETAAVAGAAKRRRYGRDDAEGRAVREPEAFRRGAAVAPRVLGRDRTVPA